MELVLPRELRPLKQRIPMAEGVKLSMALWALGKIEGVLDDKKVKTKREREELIRKIILDVTNEIIMGVEI